MWLLCPAETHRCCTIILGLKGCLVPYICLKHPSLKISALWPLWEDGMAAARVGDGLVQWAGHCRRPAALAVGDHSVPGGKLQLRLTIRPHV